MDKPPEHFGGKEIGRFPLIAKVFQGTAEWHALAEDFSQTARTLLTDTVRASKYLNKGTHGEFWRRNLIKTIFVWIEGLAFGMKRMAEKRNEHFEIGFSDAELAMLRGESYFLDDKGEAKTDKKKFPPFLSNLKFAFKAYARAHGFPPHILDDGKVDQLRVLERIRNRLTHPKSSADLTVTEDEIKLAEKVVQWLVDESTKLIKASFTPAPRPLRRAAETMHFMMTMRYLLYWDDCTAFEFPTKKAACQFAGANGGFEWQNVLIFGPY